MKFTSILSLLLAMFIHGHQLCLSSPDSSSGTQPSSLHSIDTEASTAESDGVLYKEAAGALNDAPVAPVGHVRGLRPVRNRPLRPSDVKKLPGPLPTDEKVTNYLRGLEKASSSSGEEAKISEDVDKVVKEFTKKGFAQSPLGPLELLKNWYMANKDSIKPVGRVTNVSLDENNATTKYIKKSLRTRTNNREKGERYVASEAAYKNVKVNSSRPVLVTVGIPVEDLNNLQRPKNTPNGSRTPSEASKKDGAHKNEDGDSAESQGEYQVNDSASEKSASINGSEGDLNEDGDSAESQGEYQVNDSASEKSASINGSEGDLNEDGDSAESQGEYQVNDSASEEDKDDASGTSSRRRKRDSGDAKSRKTISEMDDDPYVEFDGPTDDPYSSLPQVEDGGDDGLEPQPKRQRGGSHYDENESDEAAGPGEVAEDPHDDGTDGSESTATNELGAGEEGNETNDNPDDHIYEDIDVQSHTSDTYDDTQIPAIRRGSDAEEMVDSDAFVPAESLRECNNRLQKALEENRKLKLSLEGNN